MHPGHWLYSHAFGLESICAVQAKMDLSIHWRYLFKQRRPINIPAGQDGACITCNSEQKWLPIRTREAHATMDFSQWSVFAETHHGILADFESAAGLESSRVAFCFPFRHPWKTVAQIS